MQNKKYNFNEELNELFEKLIKSRKRGLKNMEDMKFKMIKRLDLEIKKLYAKKDFITDIYSKRKELKLQKIGVWKKFIKTSFLTNAKFIFSMPFIYMMIIPAILLHIFAEVYHNICFRLYKIPLVKPSEHFIFDRTLLPYLNWFEKFNCFYCSYFNCLISYIREIAARTERYWCPIKHTKVIPDYHNEYDKFIDYGDGEALRKKWGEIRNFEDKKYS